MFQTCDGGHVPKDAPNDEAHFVIFKWNLLDTALLVYWLMESQMTVTAFIVTFNVNLGLPRFFRKQCTYSDDELLFLQLICRSRVNKIAGSPIVLILNKLILGNHHRKLQLIESVVVLPKTYITYIHIK